jgi:hypothetical protein
MWMCVLEKIPGEMNVKVRYVNFGTECVTVQEEYLALLSDSTDSLSS